MSLLSHEEKKLNPINEKVERYHEEVLGVVKSMSHVETQVKQIDKETVRRDSSIRLEMADEAKQLQL